MPPALFRLCRCLSAARNDSSLSTLDKLALQRIIFSISNMQIKLCTWDCCTPALICYYIPCLPFIAIFRTLGKILNGCPRLSAVHVQAIHLIRPKVICTTADRQIGQRGTRRGQSRAAHLEIEYNNPLVFMRDYST